MSATGKWAPIDLGGFRLYTVKVTIAATAEYPRDQRFECVSAGRSPTDAAERIKAIYVNAGNNEVYARGFALNVFQPPSWSDDDIPEPDDPRFSKWA